MPYRLPQVHAAAGRAVFVVEGEKDADRLADSGVIATSSPAGAGKWRPEYSQALAGRRVFVIPDNDEPGRSHAEDVARHLHGIAAEIRIVELPGLPEHGDVSDWLDVGHSIEELKALARQAPELGGHAVETPTEAQESLPVGVERVGRARLYDLSQYTVANEAEGVNWLIDDWTERGKIHITAGIEKLGKTTKAARRLAAISTGGPYLGSRARLGRGVLITEMDEAGVLQLLADDCIQMDWSRVRVVFTSDYAPDERLGVIEDVCREWRPDLLVLDPVDECFGLDGDAIFNPARAGAPFDLMRSLARTGIAIDGLYHLNNQGRIANSYKFRSKPDHLYEMSGSDASEVTVKYRGRLRAIPRIRRITGNGIDGYAVQTIGGGKAGRPPDSMAKIAAALRDATEPLGPTDVALMTGLTDEASRAALRRAVDSGHARRVDRGRYVADKGSPSAQEDTDWNL